MAKRHTLATRAFGAEPGLPDIDGLSGWIAEHRGRTADIITYQLDRSLVPQISAAIGTPCAGGTFYADRIRQCIRGIRDGRATEELHADIPAIIEDAAGIAVLKKESWCALPAPRELGIADDYYHDDDEWNEAICDTYRTIMRSMRDTGISGHVLISECAGEAELASLARQKVFFFSPSPDRSGLEALLEHQMQVVTGKDQLKTVISLMDGFTIKRLFILDPDPASIRLALTCFDPDQVIGAGYCTKADDEYWSSLVSAAVYES